jgi:hypothetical protein
MAVNLRREIINLAVPASSAAGVYISIGRPVGEVWKIFASLGSALTTSLSNKITGNIRGYNNAQTVALAMAIGGFLGWDNQVNASLCGGMIFTSGFFHGDEIVFYWAYNYESTVRAMVGTFTGVNVSDGAIV